MKKFLFLLLLPGIVFAENPHHDHTTGIDQTVNYYDTTYNHVYSPTNNKYIGGMKVDLAKAIAATAAMSQKSAYYGSYNLQYSVGAATFRGELGLAFGLSKRPCTKCPLITGSIAGVKDEPPIVAAGVNGEFSGK